MTTKYSISATTMASKSLQYFQEILEWQAYIIAAEASLKYKAAYIVHSQFDNDPASEITIAVFLNGHKIWNRGDSY